MNPCPKPAPVVMDKDYRRWIADRPCVACFTVDHITLYGSEPAHVRGSRNNPDYANILPLCADHHRLGPHAFHRIGVQSFARYVGFNLERKAAEYQRWYDEKEALKF